MAQVYAFTDANGETRLFAEIHPDPAGTPFNGGTITSPLTITNDSGGSENSLVVTYLGGLNDALRVTSDSANAGIALSANGAGKVTADLVEADNDGEIYFDTNGASYVAPRTGYTGDVWYAGVAGAKTLRVASTGLGFYGATAAAKPTVTGAKLPSDVALASLLTALATLGLITDSTT